MDDLPCTDEVKVYQDEGEDVEEQVKSSENLTEDKVGLVIESEGQIPRLFDLLTKAGDSGSGPSNLFRLPMFQTNPRLASCLLPGYPAAIAAVMASLQARASQIEQSGTFNLLNNNSNLLNSADSTNQIGDTGSSSGGSGSFSVWSASTTTTTSNEPANASYSMVTDFPNNFISNKSAPSPNDNFSRLLDSNGSFAFQRKSDEFPPKLSRFLPNMDSTSLNIFQSSLYSQKSEYNPIWQGNGYNTNHTTQSMPWNGSNSNATNMNDSNGNQENPLYAACAAAMAAISSTWSHSSGTQGGEKQVRKARKKQGPRRDPAYNTLPTSPRVRPSSKGTNNSSSQSSPLSSTMLTAKLLALTNQQNGIKSPNSPESYTSLPSPWQVPFNRDLPYNLNRNQNHDKNSFESLLYAIGDMKPSNGNLQKTIRLKRKSNISSLLSDKLSVIKTPQEMAACAKLDNEREMVWLLLRTKFSRFKFQSFTDDLTVQEPDNSQSKRPKSTSAIMSGQLHSNKKTAFNIHDFMAQRGYTEPRRVKEEESWFTPPQQNSIFNFDQVTSNQSNIFGHHANNGRSSVHPNGPASIPPPPFLPEFTQNFTSPLGQKTSNQMNSNQKNNYLQNIFNDPFSKVSSPTSLHMPHQQGTKRPSTKKHYADPFHSLTNQRNGLMTGSELTGGSMKKCRARFGLEHQNLWCKPCRRKKKCIRFISEQDLEQQENNRLFRQQQQQQGMVDSKNNSYLDGIIRQQTKQSNKNISSFKKKSNNQFPQQQTNSNFLNSAAAAFLRNNTSFGTTNPSKAPQPTNLSQPTNQHGNFMSPNQQFDPSQYNPSSLNTTISKPSISSLMASMFELNNSQRNCPPLDLCQPENGDQSSLIGQSQPCNIEDIHSEIKRRKLSNIFPNFIDEMNDPSKLIAQ